MANKKRARKTPLTRLLDRAEAVDDRLHGHRRTLLVVAAVVVVAGGPLLDIWLEDTAEERSSAALVVGFGLVALVLLTGRISTWREDGGGFSLRRGLGRLRTRLERALFGIRRWWTSRLAWKLTHAGPALLRLGVVLLASQKLSQLARVTSRTTTRALVATLRSLRPFARQQIYPRLETVRVLEGDVQAVAVGLLLIGGVLSLVSLLFRRRRARTAITGALPAVLRHTDRSAIQQVLAHTQDDLLHAFVDAIHRWRPPRLASEAAYQEHLARWLGRRNVGDKVVLEEWIGSRRNGTRGRGDIIVDDWLLVEMKRGSSQSEGQRAVGQLEQYLRAWKGRGAVVVVVCAAPLKKMETLFTPVVQRHQRDGRVVFAVVVQPK